MIFEKDHDMFFICEDIFIQEILYEGIPLYVRRHRKWCY